MVISLFVLLHEQYLMVILEHRHLREIPVGKLLEIRDTLILSLVSFLSKLLNL